MDGVLKKERKPNPRENANPLSAATFSYTIPTFIKGYKKDLEVTDLTETLNEHKSARLADRIEIAWRSEEQRAWAAKRTPSLHRVLWRVFGLEFMFYGLVLAVGEFGIRLLQPIALGQLIIYYIPHQTQITERDAYLYASAVVLCSLLNVFITHPYMMGALHLGMKIRVATCSLIYRKALRLSKTALGQTTAGQLVNLLSNDVNRFDVAMIFAHQLWIGPLETAVVSYLMYLQIGVSALIGVVFLLVLIPLQIYLGRKTSVLRLRTAIRTDERVRLMNEIISGIQVIKMYTWEKPFAKLVSIARRFEIKSVRGTSYVRGILLSFIMFTTRIAIFVSIFAYVVLGERITAEQVFVITSFYNILRSTMTVFFPQGIGQVAEANVSINRLNDFMLFEENKLVTNTVESEGKEEGATVNGNASSKYGTTGANGEQMGRGTGSGYQETDVASLDKGVFITDATAHWTPATTHPATLSHITLTASPDHLLAVIGPVGSGKTSLLHAILRELPLTSGGIRVSGTVSYASQEPWLFAGSVRQNILFGQEMDRARYRLVIKRCALERDLELLRYGDRTVVGERGVSLSGGQRARINLARAVYKEADIYLLDDPLSAVDTHVGKQLFDECVTGLLKHKTCILITHQLQYLKKVDHIIILNNGAIQKQGTYRELQESGLDFAKMLEAQPIPSLDDAILLSHSSQLSLSRHNSVHSVHSDNYDIQGGGGGGVVTSNTTAPENTEEQKQAGSVGGYVYKRYFTAGGGCCMVLFLFLQFVLAQLAASGGDYFITFWVNLEERRYESGATEPILRGKSIFYSTNTNTSNSDSPLFTYDSPSNSSSPVNDTFLSPLTEESFLSPSTWSRDTCIYIYTAITIATVVLTLVRSYSFFTICMRASIRLHDKMFTSITQATMRFFNTNPSGRILNRFAKDMGAVDELLPGALIDVLQIGLQLIGIIVVVGVVNPWLLLPTGAIAGVFYWLRLVYLATGRSIKRLEGITRSPVFSHLNASIQGLTTIRAFKAEGILQKEFDNHQDLHSSAWFMFLATSRAFGFWLDMVCIIYIAIVTLSFLVFGNESFGGNVGLAITQSIGLTGMFQWGMRQSTELENQMTSVERILEYSDLPSEGSLLNTTATKEDPQPPPPADSWPASGTLEFRGVSLKYGPTEPHVLRNLSFEVKSEEKVGIVGRTGAGKSSVIAALFRLVESEGEIVLDQVDTKTVGLHELRCKLSIIPQEPVLFSGTLRKNLDPFDEYDDDVLWRALEDVELKEAVGDLAGGLNSIMSEGGSNFSVGQRQLVCLARAIIRNNKVLILDEATANVDPQTDALIQTTIREKFAACTVLTIAHRLHTVMDSDRVLVMDAGSLVEMDHPHILLQNKRGFLYSMVQQTGDTMAESLEKIAEQNYNLKKASVS